jgi:hypothetical protein
MCLVEDTVLTQDYFYCCDGVRLCLYGTAAANGPIVHPPDGTWMRMDQRWNDINRGKPKDSKRTLSQCHFIHRKFHMGQLWERTQAFAVRSRRLTACGVSRPISTATALNFVQDSEFHDAQHRIIECSVFTCVVMSTSRRFELQRKRHWSSSELRQWTADSLNTIWTYASEIRL